MSAGKFTLKLSHELHQKLFLPSMYDPLSFIETDEVLAYAKSKGKPLVAELPDKAFDSFSPLGMGSTDKKSLEAYSSEIQKGTVMVAVPDTAFTVIKPALPSSSRAERLDRNALTTLMQAAQDKGVPSLDDLCAYAEAAPNPQQGGVGLIYITLFVPGAMSIGLEGPTSWDMLRFYGQLISRYENQPEQRRQACF